MAVFNSEIDVNSDEFATLFKTGESNMPSNSIVAAEFNIAPPVTISPGFKLVCS